MVDKVPSALGMRVKGEMRQGDAQMTGDVLTYHQDCGQGSIALEVLSSLNFHNAIPLTPAG